VDRALPHQGGADRRDQQQAADLSGHHLQLHAAAEDAVDEAETGLKSGLAVKVFGASLDTLQQKGKAIKAVLEKVPGIRDVTLVRELGQPLASDIRVDRDKDRPLTASNGRATLTTSIQTRK